MESPYADLPVDHDSEAYWAGCLERRLLIQRCRECGRWVHFPRGRCPGCWSTDLVATEVSGRGTVYTFVLDPGPSGLEPTALVELDEQEGLRLPTTVVDCEPADLAIGMTVELTWIDYQGLPVPAFRPA